MGAQRKGLHPDKGDRGRLEFSLEAVNFLARVAERARGASRVGAGLQGGQQNTWL